MNSMWIIIALVAIAMLITRAKEAYAYKWRGRRNARRQPIQNDVYENEWGQRGGEDVQLFSGSRFDGVRTEFPAGQYADIVSYRPDGDNSVSSVRVPIGFSLRVYSEPDFQGKSGVFGAGNHRLSWRWVNNIASLVVVQGNLDYVTSGTGVTGL